MLDICCSFICYFLCNFSNIFFSFCRNALVGLSSMGWWWSWSVWRGWSPTSPSPSLPPAPQMLNPISTCWRSMCHHRGIQECPRLLSHPDSWWILLECLCGAMGPECPLPPDLRIHHCPVEGSQADQFNPLIIRHSSPWTGQQKDSVREKQPG